MNDAVELPQRVSYRASFGPVVALVLGVSVWVQLASFAVRGDVAVTDAVRALSIGLPMLALIGGIAGRSAIVLLALFPLTLLPPLLLTPDGAAASFGDPWSAGRACASLALFLSLVSAWLSGVDSATALPEHEAPRGYATDARYHMYPRVVPLLLWWAVPTYAIFWDPAIVGTIEQSYGDAARMAQIFASTVVFFGWAVVAYMWFIVPTLNLEYDRREIVRGAQALVAVGRREIVRRIGLTTVVVTAVTGLLALVV